MRHNDKANLAIGVLIGDLAHTIQSIEDRVEECKRYIYRAHIKRNDLIESLDEVIRADSEDKTAQTTHDKLIEDWPSMPYFMRKEDY